MKRIFIVLLVVYFSILSINSQNELVIGGQAVVYVTDPTGLRVRTGPGLAYSVIESLFSGDVVEILDGPEQADSLVWWQIRTASGNTGWSVEYANDIQTLVVITPTATTTPQPTPSLTPAVNITVTPYATISASLYDQYVNADDFQTFPLFTVPVSQSIYMMIWTPENNTLAVGAENGIVAFHNVEMHQFEIDEMEVLSLQVPTLQGGPVPENFRFSSEYRQLVEISGPASLEDPDTHEVVYFDFWFYEIGGTINDSPWPAGSLPNDIVWEEISMPVVQSACENVQPVEIAYDEGTVRAGNPASFTSSQDETLELGDGSGGIAWIENTPYVLIWSQINDTEEDEVAYGTAEVWDIRVGERITQVPHAFPYKTDCGLEARPPALSSDGRYLASAITTPTFNLLMFYELSSEEQ